MFAAGAMGDNLAFTLAASSANHSNYVALAAHDVDGNITTSKYASLNKFQCQIRFQPQTFLVAVNTTSKTILVTPQKAAERFPNADGLEVNSMALLNNLAAVVVMTQWTSILGDAILNNVANVARLNVSSTANDTVATGVGSFIESAIDNILEAQAAAQMVVLNGTQDSTATIHWQSFVLGSPIYANTVLAINCVIPVIFLAELLRTRMWRDAPRFDFTDIKDVVIYASFLGKDTVLAESSQSRDPATLAKLNVIIIDDERGTGLALSGKRGRVT
jgi:hypothetical protein